MQLVFYDDYRLGVIEGQRVVDASAAVDRLNRVRPQDLMETLITRWDELGPRIAEVSQGAGGVPVSQVRFRPPLPRPGQLVCLAGNYLEPAQPERAPFNAFLKAPTSIIGQGETVELPDAEASVFHFEPELAVVIRKTARRVAAADALAYVFGYTPFIDVSARGLPGGFFLGKSWHTFAPLGPALVTADEVPEPNNLQVRLWVNDQPRQEFSTSSMARLVPEVIQDVTNVLTLEPGDVVATGTHHESLSPIQGGDRLRLELEGLGPALTIQVHDARHRTWPKP